jgi:hypothetical protein
LNHIRVLAAATLALFVLSSAPSVRGGSVTGDITGQVTSTGGSVPGISVGSPVTGSYTYDNSTTFNGVLGPTNPLTAFSLTIGTNPVDFTLSDLFTTGVTKAGRVISGSTPSVDNLFFIINFSALSSFAGATVNSQIITNPPPQTFTASSDTAHSFAFSFTAVPAAVPVPEPSTITLLGIGCVALAGYGWRARKRSLA